VTAARPAQPLRRQAAGVIFKKGQVLLVQRAAEELLGGLWAFPAAASAAEADDAAQVTALLQAGYGLTVAPGPPGETLHHTFTHFRLELAVIPGAWLAGRLRPGATPRRWVALSALADYPMGKVDRAIADRLAAGAIRPPPAR
jgi:adenine-specific DNA glycosylase